MERPVKRETLGAAIVLAANNVIGFLVLVKVIHWDGPQTAGANIAINAVVTVAGFFFALNRPPK